MVFKPYIMQGLVGGQKKKHYFILCVVHISVHSDLNDAFKKGVLLNS